MNDKEALDAWRWAMFHWMQDCLGVDRTYSREMDNFLKEPDVIDDNPLYTWNIPTAGNTGPGTGNLGEGHSGTSPQ